MEEQNFKGMLINHCIKYKLKYDFKETSTGPSHNPRFTFYALINDDIRGEAEEKTKKLAANMASKIALLSLQSSTVEPVPADVSATVATTTVPTDAKAEVTPSSSSQTSPSAADSQSAANTSDLEMKCEPNYIGTLNQFCQRKKMMFSFLETVRGPSHVPEIFCRGKLGDREFPEAKGKNKKEAKKKAAYLALKELQKEYPDDILMPSLDDSFVEGSESGNSSLSESGDCFNSETTTANGTSKGETSTTDTEKCTSFMRPSTPTRPQRKVELAPKFTNEVKANGDQCTCDKTFLQDFHHISDIDSGAFGQVYKARKILDEKYYAVKKVKIENFKGSDELKEVRTLANVEHSHIVRYYHAWAGEDYFPDDSYSSNKDKSMQKCLFIQMEWCEGGTLKQWIKAMKQVNEERSLEIARQISDGVAYIHSHKLIHRDLKPANIFFAKDQKVKIGDFGLVTQMTGEKDKASLQRTQGTGTPSYMAPEQKGSKYENEVDIFALGLILVELFWIFGSGHERVVEWNNIRDAKLPALFKKQYANESALIKKMLSEDPQKRPKASAVKDLLDKKTKFLSAKTC